MAIPQWLHKWTGPSGLLLLLGGITWGVQINILSLANAESIAALELVTAKQAEQHADIVNQLSRTAIILSIVEKRVNESVNKSQQNRERIIGLEQPHSDG